MVFGYFWYLPSRTFGDRCGPQKYHDVQATRGDGILVVQSVEDRMSENGSWSVEPMPMQL